MKPGISAAALRQAKYRSRLRQEKIQLILKELKRYKNDFSHPERKKLLRKLFRLNTTELKQL